LIDSGFVTVAASNPFKPDVVFALSDKGDERGEGGKGALLLKVVPKFDVKGVPDPGKTLCLFHASCLYVTGHLLNLVDRICSCKELVDGVPLV
jgi:hypothetical protein